MPEVAHRRSHRVVRARSARGETLLEILVAVALMTVGMLAVITSLFASSSTAKLNTERTRVSVFLQTWGDLIEAPRTPGGSNNYGPCQNPLTDANAAGLPSGWTGTLKTEFLGSVPATSTGWNSLNWVGIDACTAQGDKGLQRVTLNVKTKAGKFQTKDSLVLIRRNTACPASFNNADLGPC